MKCPDCGELLQEMSLMGADKSYRCFKCGGFWVDGWVVNRLETRTLQRWSKLDIDPGFLSFGTNVCPVDGSALNRFKGESVPANMVVKRCDRCGRWWFPMDTLLNFKPAQEAKINYFKLWGLTTDVSSMVLPVLGILITLIGTVVGVRLLAMRQQEAIQAASVVSGFGATNLGSGSVLLGWKSNTAISEVEYRKVGEVKWMRALPEKNGEVYLLKLNGLDIGNYEVRILGKVFRFKILF